MANRQGLEEFLDKISDKEVSKKISKFMNEDTAAFTEALSKIESKIEGKDISLNEATQEYGLATKELLEHADELEKGLKRQAIIKKIKALFRLEVVKNSPVYKSSLVKRAYDKPRGYPGDYQTLEYIYDNEPISEGIGYCGDKYILRDDYVMAVRNRKDMMKNILRDFINNAIVPTMNILNLGCGSCREVRELLKSGFIPKLTILFTLIDQDKEALDFSRDRLDANIENLKFNFIQENIVRLGKVEKYRETLKGQDLIYTIGLADYIPDIFLSGLINFCFGLLKPRGQLVVGHKNIQEYKATAPDWFCDWYFFPRSKDKFCEIVKSGLEGSKFEISFSEEETKHIFFISITKR